MKRYYGIEYRACTHTGDWHLPCNFLVLSEDDRAQVEACKRCGRKEVYYKSAKGRIDSKRYYQDHVGDFAQRNDPGTKRLFNRLYRDKRVVRAEQDT